MATDWSLIRDAMNCMIDSCEQLERMKIADDERGLATDINGSTVTVWDFLQSAWTYPENLRDTVVRLRHRVGDDKPYTNELARALVNTAKMCAELVGAERLDAIPEGYSESIRAQVMGLCRWYSGHCLSQVGALLQDARGKNA